MPTNICLWHVITDTISSTNIREEIDFGGTLFGFQFVDIISQQIGASFIELIMYIVFCILCAGKNYRGLFYTHLLVEYH